MRKNYCTQHPRASIDEEHAQCFPGELCGETAYPGQAGMLEEIYQDAMREPYGYLVIDMSPHAQDEYRLRSKIFPGEDPIIYIPRKV